MSEKYEITGTLHHLDEIQTFGSGFQKREFVIETSGKYPQQIKLEATKNAIQQLESLQLGTPLSVKFNLRGNEHNGRYYVNLQAWSIQSEGGQQQAPQQQPMQQQPAQKELPVAQQHDDIPF